MFQILSWNLDIWSLQWRSNLKELLLTARECHLLYGISVTCHPIPVNTPTLLNPRQASRCSVYLPLKDRRLSWPRWLVTYWDGLLQIFFDWSQRAYFHSIRRDPRLLTIIIHLYLQRFFKNWNKRGHFEGFSAPGVDDIRLRIFFA